MKVCSKCRIRKPNSAFHKKAKAKDGLQSACKDCNKKAVQDWQEKNPEYWLTQKARLDTIAIQRRARTYGVTVEEMTRLLAKTHCQVCNKKFGETAKHIDHDHKTGKVRGVLCGMCNRGLGHFNDDPKLLVAALRYLNMGL